MRLLRSSPVVDDIPFDILVLCTCLAARREVIFESPEDGSYAEDKIGICTLAKEGQKSSGLTGSHSLRHTRTPTTVENDRSATQEEK